MFWQSMKGYIMVDSTRMSHGGGGGVLPQRMPPQYIMGLQTQNGPREKVGRTVVPFGPSAPVKEQASVLVLCLCVCMSCGCQEVRGES